MKTGQKRVIVVATAVVGLFCCNQIFNHSDEQSPESQAKNADDFSWQFVSPVPSDGQDLSIADGGVTEPKRYLSLEGEFQISSSATTEFLASTNHVAADANGESELSAPSDLEFPSLGEESSSFKSDDTWGSTNANEVDVRQHSNISQLQGVLELPPIDGSHAGEMGVPSQNRTTTIQRLPETRTADNETVGNGIQNPHFRGNVVNAGSRVANLPVIETTGSEALAETGTVGSADLASSAESKATTNRVVNNPFAASNTMANASSSSRIANGQFQATSQSIAKTSAESEQESLSLVDDLFTEDTTPTESNQTESPTLDITGDFRSTAANSNKGVATNWPTTTRAAAPMTQVAKTPAAMAPQQQWNDRDRSLQANSANSVNVTRTNSVRMLQPMKTSSVVEERAMEHVTYGKSLARRGSTFSARQEFIQALRMVADSHDHQSGTRDYSTKLASALRVLKEAGDFVTVDSEQQIDMDLTPILEAHSTALIDPTSARSVTPIQALQVYYSFAQQELSQAVGQSPVASEALFSLGKMLTTGARRDISGKPMDPAKAMVMHHAALTANSANHQSANELGVLMARNGHWQQSRELFMQSLQANQTVETWQNLARAHQRLGETDLARRAFNEYEFLAQNSDVQTEVGSMNWVNSDQFETFGAMPEIQAEAVARTAQAPAPVQKPAKGILRSFKKMF